ncbi:hypothetical protein CEP52_008321 [Fusarium oligoseptatum]|uniref:NACHT-NTPase and P-loop NTPases N-terminal domain-containing protein n=1 Tax=Fusarium oligoseptatum TaxID=2604345 RepID=A0A428TIF7_9HYPO|nr:hypothetical protein CEP52_008321 [Fusarium oligoseptatum]
MAELALGVVSLTFQVVSLVNSVIDSFDRIQNAPQELRDFRQGVVRLQRHFEFLGADVSGVPDLGFLHVDDATAIEETLTLCKDLLQQQVNRQEGMVTKVVRGVWTLRNSQKLVKYKNQINDHYTQIILPSWLRWISARNYYQPPQQEYFDPTVEVEPDDRSSLVSAQQLQSMSQSLDELRAAYSREEIEHRLFEIDNQVRAWRVELGLDDGVEDDDYLFPRRPSTLSYEYAPTTLYLESAPPQHRKIRLERLHIMARDDESRILQYQDHDATIHVTHIVPFGSIPWTPELSSKRVSFLKDHLITVVDGEGYHLYRLHPKYKFHDQDACEKFQSTLRERDFCGAYEPVEIKMGSRSLRTVARRQLIRQTGCHEELNLADFEPINMLPRRRSLSGFGKKPAESGLVELYPYNPNSKRLNIKFETSEEATDFKQRFDSIQRGTYPSPPSIRSESRNTGSSLAPTPSLTTSLTSPTSSTAPSITMDIDTYDEANSWGAAFLI